MKVTTTPFEGQKPGTSGLRKPTSTFTQAHYLENFVQSVFTVVKKTCKDDGAKGSVLVVGGDGRFFVKDAVQTIIKIAHANGFGKVIVGHNGIFSTPAVSRIIRKENALGGLILSASHNPGGEDGDFGVKYNINNGGPAPSSFTNAVFEESKTISEYEISDMNDIDIDQIATTQVDEHFVVDVVDSVDEYVTMCKELFDFDALKALVSSASFHMHIDCLNGVSGPYAQRIFEDELGAMEGSVVNSTPLPDFGGLHPDPNLVHAHELVEKMNSGDFDFGAAFDGDADRNMIMGKDGFFVTPSDSVAIIAASNKHIKYLAKDGLKGFSRSMPTGAALDHVAAKLGVNLYIVPTGWKFFGNLMDAGLLTICGEESFGTGSDHVREKDGVWAALCWLSILANSGESVRDITVNHWKEFGRNYFTRYDYEKVTSEAGAAVMELLRQYIADQSLVGTTFESGHVLASCDDFKYVDVTNNEVTEKQGCRFVFEDNSRIIFRLSGTGSSGATIRMYVDSYESDPSKCLNDVKVQLKPLVDAAVKLAKIKELTGRKEPSVIT
eukprot:m.240639 g.240639  ORF g.240639 m.240639 type:complete len:553 (+) comp15636_c0_seq1:395-2053(+)